MGTQVFRPKEGNSPLLHYKLPRSNWNIRFQPIKGLRLGNYFITLKNKIMEKIILGCDVSKDTLDFFCSNTQEHFVLPNHEAGLKKLLSWVRQHRFNLDSLRLAFENTGAYSERIRNFCAKQGITFYQIPPLELKRSLGLARGKNDKVDAMRIARYLKEKEYKLTPSQAPSPIHEELARLRTQRSLLIKQRTSQKNNLRLFQDIRNIPGPDLSVRIAKKMIHELDSFIKQIEQKILEILQSDKELILNYSILLSIKGIGPVNAIMLLVETANFTRFSQWRSAACYCGCAPFESSSGKQKSKPQTSYLAQKEMKSTLTRAARSAAKHDPGLRSYMERKLGEGKAESLVINNIRCKILARAFALIRDQRLYETNYPHDLVA